MDALSLHLLGGKSVQAGSVAQLMNGEELSYVL